ncbi:DNA repair protein RecO [Candidatus Dojkabacteria bacterium]|nr:DNA repair protein RecO [Candidatus Dojkabacteria bacterium]
MAVYRDEVAILKSRDINEYDKIVTLFGRWHGKFSAIAKGVRRLSSRKRGHLETFNLCRVSCAQGKSLDLILEAQSYFSIDTKDTKYDEYERVGFAGFVVDKFVPDNVQEGKIFDMWTDFIQGQHGKTETIDFILNILLLQGFVSEENIEKLRLGQVNQVNQLTFEKIKLFVQKIIHEI